MRNLAGLLALGFSLTPEAQAVQAAWNPEDDLTMQCIAGGMPGVMTRVSAPHPIDFVQHA